MATTLNLCFAIIGESQTTQPFMRDVGRTLDTEELKNTIYEFKKPLFKNVKDASSLVLYRTNVPSSKYKSDKEFSEDIVKSLEPMAGMISTYFSDGAEENKIHIIVKRPRELKRRLDDDDFERPLKHFKASSIVHREARRYVYYADQTESNKPLIKSIQRGEFVRVYGARASGKSSRIVDAMKTLTAKGFECIYVDLQYFDVKIFWSVLSQRLQVYGPENFSDSCGFQSAFSVGSKIWKRPVVIFFDEFDVLRMESWNEVRKSILRTFRALKNDPSRESNNPTHVIHSIVSIGTYAILQLNLTGEELSPFNPIDDFQNTSLSLDQVRELYLQFAKDRDIVIEECVMEDIFIKTNGHAGLVNVCGVAVEECLPAQANSERVNINDWSSIQNTLISRMKQYRTFQKLVADLTGKDEKRMAALTLYRNMFLGSTTEIDVPVHSPRERQFAEHLTALGVLCSGPLHKFSVASPLMDSLIRRIVIPTAFPNAPKTRPLMRSDDSLDILGTIKSALLFFDKDLIERARRVSYKTASSPIRVGRHTGQRVPRESVYDSELLRILANWLTSLDGYQVIGQYHIGGVYCDIVIRQGGDTVALELVVTEIPQVIQAHIDKIVNYKELVRAKEGWVIHFTKEDNYLKNRPVWPAQEMLDNDISIIHIWHNHDFTQVRLSAWGKDSHGNVVQACDEHII
ncbi:hypothetical protein BGX27_000884 [Mortierella sp. AM989]|nr:hypothetical protein BGX27_000884 [Mortierella sp. AM989]